MLELEQRQATDSAFRQATGGGAVGWLRGRYSVGTTVPVVLFRARGRGRRRRSAEMVDALTPKNRESGNDYRGRARGRHRPGATTDASTTRRSSTVVDSAKHFLNISAFDWKTDTRRPRSSPIA